MTAKKSKLRPDPENQNDDLPSRIERCKGALTAPTLATFLGMSRTTIYEMAATNRLPYYRIGCMVRFDPVTIAEWLRSQSVPLAP
jgi:excisionase family DNA binding protein